MVDNGIMELGEPIHLFLGSLPDSDPFGSQIALFDSYVAGGDLVSPCQLFDVSVPAGSFQLFDGSVLAGDLRCTHLHSSLHPPLIRSDPYGFVQICLDFYASTNFAANDSFSNNKAFKLSLHTEKR